MAELSEQVRKKLTEQYGWAFGIVKFCAISVFGLLGVIGAWNFVKTSEVAVTHESIKRKLLEIEEKRLGLVNLQSDLLHKSKDVSWSVDQSKQLMSDAKNMESELRTNLVQLKEMKLNMGALQSEVLKIREMSSQARSNIITADNRLSELGKSIAANHATNNEHSNALELLQQRLNSLVGTNDLLIELSLRVMKISTERTITLVQDGASAEYSVPDFTKGLSSAKDKKRNFAFTFSVRSIENRTTINFKFGQYKGSIAVQKPGTSNSAAGGQPLADTGYSLELLGMNEGLAAGRDFIQFRIFPSD